MSYTKAQREAKARKEAEEKTNIAEETVTKESGNDKDKIVSKRLFKNDLPLNMLVECANGTYGKLVYVSSRTNEIHEWEEFGSTEYLELNDLISMRNSQKRFFTENWIMIDDAEVLRFLGVEKFYENALNYDEINQLFELDPSELAAKINGMSKGMKNTIALFASDKIQDGSLDSRRMISELESLLEVDLIEQ